MKYPEKTEIIFPYHDYKILLPETSIYRRYSFWKTLQIF